MNAGPAAKLRDPGLSGSIQCPISEALSKERRTFSEILAILLLVFSLSGDGISLATTVPADATIDRAKLKLFNMIIASGVSVDAWATPRTSAAKPHAAGHYQVVPLQQRQRRSALSEAGWFLQVPTCGLCLGVKLSLSDMCHLPSWHRQAAQCNT